MVLPQPELPSRRILLFLNDEVVQIHFSLILAKINFLNSNKKKIKRNV